MNFSTKVKDFELIIFTINNTTNFCCILIFTLNNKQQTIYLDKIICIIIHVLAYFDGYMYPGLKCHLCYHVKKPFFIKIYSVRDITSIG